MSRDKPLHLEIAKFVKYHLGKDCFAPLTGQDHPTWKAFVYLLQCFAHGGGDDAIAAMRATVQCAQRTHSVLRVFVQAIPGVMDWQDVARLWPKICPPDSPTDLFAIERSEVYRGDSKHVEVDIQRWRAA